MAHVQKKHRNCVLCNFYIAVREEEEEEEKKDTFIPTSLLLKRRDAEA
ncbi:MAG: hypothetical protein JSV13_07970 [Nitrospiraceae bacterium]|nr:MAG: hypothetical protein JSV13_07970 [Nitrospiraceae bacterium]